MNNSIVPDSTPIEKSDSALTGSPLRKTKYQILQDWIEDTEYAIQALQIWLASLKSWQSQDRIADEDFDRAYEVICDATLSEWAWVGIVELRAVVTGEQTE